MLLTIPRASYDTPVKMRSGVYFTGNGGTLALPMTIEARGGGPVVIFP